jgi:hypothetical protein
MRRTSILLALVALAAGTGCAPSNPGLTLDGVLAPDAMCTWMPNNNYLAQGVLDISHPERTGGVRYFAVMRVGNHLINRQNTLYPVMADPDQITITGARVTILNTDGQRIDVGLPNPYNVTASGTVASTTSSDPVLGSASTEFIDSARGAALAGMFAADTTIVLQVQAIGTTSGGSTLTSGPYSFPLLLCNGCLFQCGCDSMGNPTSSLSCNPGQDRLSQINCGPGSCP